MESQLPSTNNDAEELVTPLEINLRAMVGGLRTAQPSSIRRASPTSSLGQLDVLPTELLLLTFDYLDFQSLSRLSRACLRGKALVESLPAYREIMEHAPGALIALGKTRLLRHHPAPLLRRTLRSGKCVSCLSFGGFLFLPTCERVCSECLGENYGLRVIPLYVAKKCFRLTERQLGGMPVLHSIPGPYYVTCERTHRRVHRLVCVREAKRLAIDMHGSAEDVAKFMPEAGPRTKQFWLLRHYHEAPLEPPGCDMSTLPGRANDVEDDYSGMASMRFPWLTDAGPDGGRVCRGCAVTFRDHVLDILPAGELSRLVPEGCSPYRPLNAMMNRLRPRREFLEHVGECYGARQRPFRRGGI